jgi:3-methyladenine DNA glycosylase AlkD
MALNIIVTIQKELRLKADAKKSILLARYFKTGPGEYAEGDKFLGLTVPMTRAIVKKYARDATLDDVKQLIQREYHEERLTALLILVYFAKHKKYSVSVLGDFYMSHVQHINNWDLVDLSSPRIIGPYVSDNMTHDVRKRFIDDCIASKHLWTVRIIVLASFYPISLGNEKMSLYIASHLLHHKHDLIHKAVGWMLREVGKRVNESALTDFLDQHTHEMPRTMLRYAIERLSVEKRRHYMAVKQTK